MSEKLKFSSCSSTPIKGKISDNSSVSPTPSKGSKYKNFLTAVLTPSQTKKWLKRKKSSKSEKSFKEKKADVEEIYRNSQISEDFGEPGYSTIEELRSKVSSYEDSGSILNTEIIHGSSSQIVDDTKTNSENVVVEPVYSTINKKKKLKNIKSDDSNKGDSFQIQSSVEIQAEHMPSKSKDKENVEPFYKTIVEEQKEEIKLLVERMKELTKENKDLHKNIESILKEEKWKEDSLHAELKLKITQLEADTHKEVKCLSERITILVQERKVLTEQMHILHEEKKLLQAKYEKECIKVKSMISPEFLKKIVDEHEILLNKIKKKHEEEMKKLHQENEMNLESKIVLIAEVEELKEKIHLLTSKNESLKYSEGELLQEKNRILRQLEESKQMQEEAQNLLTSLLKITETISVERDVLLNKASFQDHQQKLLQSTMIDYSLNMGRLQEHISNISREKLEELQKLKLGECQRDESLKDFYGKQLDLLRSKVLNQSNTIIDLESEKSKLELQLESLWQAACVGKPKTDDLRLNHNSTTF